MLSREQNERLTQVGPGTPMGRLLRAYWLPLLHSHELPKPDGPPMRVRLLGENLVAFRDTSGRVGLLDHHCPHRTASLVFGRNEDGGLRCLYHGWKFDVDGRCLDIPTEPPACPMLQTVAARAYPCREQAGVIWTYMGEGAPPPLPDLGWATASIEHKTTLKYQRQCNWVQAMEGDFDSAHLGFLHQSFGGEAGDGANARGGAGDRLRAIVAADLRPSFEVRPTPAGVCYAARRDGPNGAPYWRVTQFQLPVYTSVPAYGGLNRLKAWVPLDDEHTMVWEANWSPTTPLDAATRAGLDGRIGPSGFLPDTDDWLGRHRLTARADNDYLLDRARQKSVNFSGMEDVTPVQDAAMQESMGAVADRTREHLSASDAPIIQMRRRLLDAAGALEQDAASPPGAAEPARYRGHGVQFLADDDADWGATYQRLMDQAYATR